MVSALSSRLLYKAPPNSGINAYNARAKSNSLNSDSLSGYSADKETAPVLPPVLIDLHPKHQRRDTDQHRQAKRRKLNEMNYLAAIAKTDIAKAGRPYPLIMTARSRIIPGLDLTKVQLLSSRSVQSSPFLHPQSSGWASEKYDQLIGSVYKNLLIETSAAYNGSYYEDTYDENASSYTSSISDTDSDDGVDIQIVKDQTKMASTPKRKSSIPSISMEEAIGVCDFPRLVLVATAPYEAVFVNAAYESLTGLSSSETLGKTMAQLVSPIVPGKINLESYAMNSNEGRDISVSLFGDGGKFKSVDRCNMKVTPIISRTKSLHHPGAPTTSIRNDESVGSISHFAVDFPNFIKRGKSNNTEDSQLKQKRGSSVLRVVA